jgi:hypothetical protein
MFLFNILLYFMCIALTMGQIKEYTFSPRFYGQRILGHSKADIPADPAFACPESKKNTIYAGSAYMAYQLSEYTTTDL